MGAIMKIRTNFICDVTATSELISHIQSALETNNLRSSRSNESLCRLQSRPIRDLIYRSPKVIAPRHNKTHKVLSLFTGCGGMDLGFEGGFDVLKKSINEKIHPEWIVNSENSDWVQLPKTNFEVVFANDIVPAAQKSWCNHFHKHDTDAKFHLESIVDLVKEHQASGNVFPQADVVIGGFPCQDFSVAGKRNGFKSEKSHRGKKLSDIDDPSEENRGKLYMWMKKVIEIVKPKVFIAENVKGLVSLADVKQIIENDFRNIGSGYVVVDAKVLFAPDYGIPQSRKRVIFIGFRKDALLPKAIEELGKADISDRYNPYPPKTHSLCGTNTLTPYVTSGEYLSDLPEPEESDDYSHQTYSKAKWHGSHCQGQTEININGVAPTIRSEHHGNIEFRRLSKDHGGKINSELDEGLPERRLSVRECARIQTFPDSFEFVVPKSADQRYTVSGSEAYKLVGNAVPPLLAFHIAWSIQELWPLIMK